MSSIPSVERRVAIVTGASGGIGSAVAERLARDGFCVVVNFAGRAEPAEALVLRLVGAGAAAIAVRADISDPKGMTSLFDAAEHAWGGVDVLVNLAGVMKLAPIVDTEDALFDQTVAVNLKGVFNGLREAGRRIRDGGRIVSFSSSVVGMYQPTYGVYAATKAGVEAMTRVFSKELRGRGVTVNAVSPGPVGTPLFTAGKAPELIDAIAKANPFERLGEPVDIANAVSFLAGPDGGWINGQVLRANGGAI